ncbi:MAG: molybdopterin converting factor subunit 1 [Alphaproteobacteria bacterium]
MITVLYFAWLRDRIGQAEESIELPDGVVTVEALIDSLCQRSPGHAAAFAQRDAIRAAVNQVFAAPEDKLSAGDEVAFFPPMTGG